jgi:hypothetical protein
VTLGRAARNVCMWPGLDANHDSEAGDWSGPGAGLLDRRPSLPVFAVLQAGS